MIFEVISILNKFLSRIEGRNESKNISTSKRNIRDMKNSL